MNTSRIEYCLRNNLLPKNLVDVKGWCKASKGFGISNRCSVCRLIGHNKQNHDDRLIEYLEGHNLLAGTADALENLDDD
jgi:hypothetical protein